MHEYTKLHNGYNIFRRIQTKLHNAPLLVPFPLLEGLINLGVVGTLVTGDPLPMLFTVGAAELLPFEFFLGEVC
jgi:hypothetical protein